MRRIRSLRPGSTPEQDDMGMSVHARKVIPALGAFATFAAIAASTASAAHSTQAGPGPIRITDVQTSYSFIRGRTRAHGAGAVELVKQRLYNPSISSKPIGRSTLMCTYFDPHDRTCVGTYFLPKGSLVVTGTIQSRLIYEIAVVGGTGLYANDRGTLTVTSTRLRPVRHEVLVFRLTN
jgi:hypothetical protein